LGLGSLGVAVAVLLLVGSLVLGQVGRAASGH